MEVAVLWCLLIVATAMLVLDDLDLLVDSSLLKERQRMMM